MASILQVEQLKGLTSGDNANTVVIPTGQKMVGTDTGSFASPGQIVQIQYTQFTEPSSNINFTVSVANTPVVSTSFNVTITPKFSNSVIKLEAFLSGEYSSQGNNWNNMWLFRRGASTYLGATNYGSRYYGITTATVSYPDANDGNSTMEPVSMVYFDSPATTSATTYHVALNGAPNTYTPCRTYGDTNGANFERGCSFISATEIAQ